VWLALWATFQFVVLEAIVLLLIVLFTALGIWATAKLTPFWGDDPSRVVVDEMVGVWIALLMAVEWKTAIAALLLFRLFDIVKPLGIRSIDRRQGAFWVMADDIVAGIYAAVCMIPLYLIYTWVG
jgi:phosphatidylglycerophosphatase A